MSRNDGEGSGREQANALVASFGRSVGDHKASLDASDDRSFGECGFHYDPDRDVLEGRVFIERTWTADDGPDVQANFRKVAAALNDPEIGGMFETAGGRFRLDEAKRMLFLTKDFPVASTSAGELKREMEEMLDVGAVWTTRWLARVAGIAHGWQPPPTNRVTRESEPRR